jgi:DnaJ-class molecular chaperone
METTTTPARSSSAGCWRCNGTGVYRWGVSVNGRMSHEGPCFRCVGGGQFPPVHRRRRPRVSSSSPRAEA